MVCDEDLKKVSKPDMVEQGVHHYSEEKSYFWPDNHRFENSWNGFRIRNWR